ncbi:MAG: aminotransferase class IV [Verrucomicrobiota bacterium]
MLVSLNGRLVPEDQALVSVFDRSFLYGDGLFETLRVRRSAPFRWEQHFARLEQGAGFLGIRLPFTSQTLRAAAQDLIDANQTPEALLRVTLSRGVGHRGYSPARADAPAWTLTTHEIGPAPAAWKLHVSSIRLPEGEALAHFKTCNKLPQILARAEAEHAGADEALLCNTRGHIVEGAACNLFWIENQTVCTPPLAAGILAGVTRSVVLEICRSLNLATLEKNIAPDQITAAAGVFLSLSSWGIVEADSLDDRPLPSSAITSTIRKTYEECLRKETGG